MQQHARNAPWGSPGPSQSNPSRTNNDRDHPSDRDSGLDSFERPAVEISSGGNTERANQTDKVRQVTQNFFKRAALVIVESRVSLAPSYNPNTKQVRSTKWFQMILDDSDVVTQDVADWVYLDYSVERPNPLTVEIYLDIAELTRMQTLVLVDERGKKWDVCEMLKPPVASVGARAVKTEKGAEVILERWRIWLDDPPAAGTAAANEPMPNVYKKAVVLFRSLFTYCRLLPTWQFTRRIAKEPTTLTALRPMFRIVGDERPTGTRDLLTTALYPTAGPTCETYTFTPIKSPAGAMNINVTYRRNCDFRVDSYESLASSKFRGMDVPYEKVSPGSTPSQELPFLAEGKEVGSLPVDRRWHGDRVGGEPTYGSLTTYHQTGHLGTSPISALRAARDLDDSTEDSPQKNPPDHRTSQSSKSSLRSGEVAPANPRRVSVSFQPFKAGSLSSSPARQLMISPSPPSSSVPRGSDVLMHNRNRASSSALPQAALRIPPQPAPEVAVGSPSSSSPKAPTVTRYSSSFGHRRSRFSSSGGSIGKEEETSSARGSQSSSKRGSTVLEGEAASASPGSMLTDDDNISDFLSLLEAKRDLKSFNRTDDASKDASGRRTASALSKYRGMRDSNAALGDSISSSMMIHRSSNSSSQRLSGAPPTLVGASVSTSSSPGKPLSPHTPHTPAVPSRLSELASHATTSSSSSPTSAEETTSTGSAARNRPIPIPTSPQRYPQIRRSSSAHQRHRTEMPELEQYDLRPSSLPLDDRPELSLSELIHMQQGAASEEASEHTDDNAASIGPSRPVMSAATQPSQGFVYRPRLSRGGSGNTVSSFGRGSSSRFSNRPGSATGSGSGANTGDDEEPLLFTMSELGRRSLEDIAGRGESSSGRERNTKSKREGW